MVARDVSKSTLTSYLSSSTEVKADRVIVYDAENPTAHGPWKLRAQASLSKHGLLAGISVDDIDFITWVDALVASARCNDMCITVSNISKEWA